MNLILWTLAAIGLLTLLAVALVALAIWAILFFADDERGMR